jgi:hypothetical protein
MGKKPWSEHVDAVLESLRLKAEGKDTPEEIARKVGLSNTSSLYDLWKKFWREEYPIMKKAVEAVASLGKDEKGTYTKGTETKAELADKDFYFLAPPYGGVVKNGMLFPKPDGNEYETLCSLYEDYVGPDPEHTDGLSLEELHKKYSWLSTDRIRGILRDHRYINQWVYAKKPHNIKGDPLLDLGLFLNAQRRRPPGGHTHIGFPYRWQDKKPAIDDVKKKKLDEMVEMIFKGTYIDEKTGEECLATVDKVTEKFGVDRGVLLKLGEEVTGFIGEDGEPSGYPAVMKRVTYEKLKETLRKRRKTGKTLEAEFRWKKLKPKILAFVGNKGAWRSDIVSELKLSPDMVKRMVKSIKEEKPPWLIERQDGLLYKATLPVPEVPIMSRRKGFREKYRNIRSHMSRWITLEELMSETGYSQQTISWYLKKMGDVECVGACSAHSRLMYRISPLETRSEKEEQLLNLMNMGSPEHMVRILRPMLMQPLGTFEIVRTTHMAKSSVSKMVGRLNQGGIVKKASGLRGKWRIKDEWIEPIKKLLNEVVA